MATELWSTSWIRSEARPIQSANCLHPEGSPFWSLRVRCPWLGGLLPLESLVFSTPRSALQPGCETIRAARTICCRGVVPFCLCYLCHSCLRCARRSRYGSHCSLKPSLWLSSSSRANLRRAKAHLTTTRAFVFLSSFSSQLWSRVLCVLPRRPCNAL